VIQRDSKILGHQQKWISQSDSEILRHPKWILFFVEFFKSNLDVGSLVGLEEFDYRPGQTLCSGANR
jgi:hypothetical protein